MCCRQAVASAVGMHDGIALPGLVNKPASCATLRDTGVCVRLGCVQSNPIWCTLYHSQQLYTTGCAVAHCAVCGIAEQSGVITGFARHHSQLLQTTGCAVAHCAVCRIAEQSGVITGLREQVAQLQQQVAEVRSSNANLSTQLQAALALHHQKQAKQ
jgi:uncharacterized coiled-coil protein SlyX